MTAQDYVIQFTQLGLNDLDNVGGKNASLGELISNLNETAVKVPLGFATTAKAYWDFFELNNLNERIFSAIRELNVEDVKALAEVGQTCRDLIMAATLPERLVKEITQSYLALSQTKGCDAVSVAVRSSATAEDLPDASFAGQQETYLNIKGIDAVLSAVRRVYASLYNNRAIAYRVHQGFSHEHVALSVGIQLMVRSDLATSGVMFTLDTESGFDKVVFITSAYGLGETIVQGVVNPDEFYVYKPNLAAKRPAILRRILGSKLQKMVYASQQTSEETITLEPVDREQQLKFSLNDEDVETLARYGVAIEKHYGKPMDIEWAKDGENGLIYIVQARPETVKSHDNGQVIQRFEIINKSQIKVEGRAIGQRIGQGQVRLIRSIAEMDKINPGDVLVTDMTDPDWEPIMQKAAAIVTNRGGRTCHAAIIAREMGIPAVVGCGKATQSLIEGEWVTVSCAEGDTGYVYAGKLDYHTRDINIDAMPSIPVDISMNVANPERAFDFCRLPNAGIGLARLEFIINRMIGIHPKALLEFESLPSDLQQTIAEYTTAYPSPVAYYVQRLAEGIASLAAAFFPKKVIVRLSDFKSNEYANLIGGRRYEPEEENPMLGFRGASRYISDTFRDCFELECKALHYVRHNMGLTNVQIMVPFVRTPAEGRQVLQLLKTNGLVRGEHDLKIIMMCELPSNAVLADTFLEDFDGFSIGSNDLTQLTLGLDRDSGLVAATFDEREPAVKVLLHQAIQACKKKGKYVGICGQGPSDYPDFAKWLLDEGIDSISLNPDTVLDTWLYLAGEHDKQ